MNKKYGKIVTVFTDASFCHKTLAAGYAIWMKTDGATYRHAAPFKVAIRSPGEAETAALANGIIWAATKFNLAKGDILVANSDCLPAIRSMEAVKNNRNKLIQSFVNKVNEEKYRRRFKLILKHVPAHKGYGNKRTAVNEWCDISAKKIMRDERVIKKFTVKNDN